MKRGALIIWLLIMAVAGLVAWRSPVSTDMSFTFPKKPTDAQQKVLQSLQNSAISRVLMVSIEGGTSATRANASRLLHQQLAGNPMYLRAQNGSDGNEADRDFLFQHRYLLSPNVTPDRFGILGLRSAFADSIDLLTSPLGEALKPFFFRDPTGEFPALLLSLGPTSQPTIHDGVWTSADGTKALLIVETKATGFDLDGQLNAQNDIRQRFDNLVHENGWPMMTLTLAGQGVFATESRKAIKQDITRLSLIGTIAILLLLFAFYRSFKMMVVGILPAITAVVVGIATVHMFFGTVAGITIAFGTALIGEAVDFPIYYLIQSRAMTFADWRRTFWPTIRLGALISMCGFGTLLWSDFSGLAQLGVYSLSGLTAAVLTTRFLLPRLWMPAPSMVPASHDHFFGRLSLWLQQDFRKTRYVLLSLGAVVALFLVFQRDPLWSSNLLLLSSITREQVSTEENLRTELGVTNWRYSVLVSNESAEGALRDAEAISKKLDEAKIPVSHFSPTRFLPSRATQSLRQSALPEREELQLRLPLAIKGLPLSLQKLTPFVDDVAAARQAPQLSRAELAKSSLGLAVDAMVVNNHGRTDVIMPLFPAAGHDIVDADQVRQTLSGTGAVVLDLRTDFERMYAGYLHQAIKLTLISVLAIAFLLRLALGSWYQVLQIFLPLTLAVLLVMAGLIVTGHSLQLLHLVGLLLVVVVGSNYVLFFARAQGRPYNSSLLSSLVLATLSTAIGYGVLMTSHTPVLRSMGQTVMPGVVLTFLLSIVFFGRDRQRIEP